MNMRDLWIMEYERALDDYGFDLEKQGEQDAKDNLKSKLRALGFDQHEIDNELSAIDA